MFIYLFRYCRYFKSPHSSTKTGNSVDRPMFQTSLLHQIGNSVDRPMLQTQLVHQIGNSVDRPMIKPTLVHKKGQFHGQTHSQSQA